jgi:hypothetical protein
MKHSYRKFAVLGMLAALALAPTLRADEAASSSVADDQEEMRATLGNLTAQMNDLKKWADEIPKISVNTDIRYDTQTYAAGTAATTNSAPVLFQTTALPNGKAGMSAKRIEFEVWDKISSWAKWYLQVDFAAEKIEDLGVEMDGLSLLPYVNTGSYTMDVKIGNFRQPFGIEQQTGSSSIPFSERALMYGGANPFAGVGAYTQNFAVAKLVTERVMGIHVKQAKDFGPLAYSVAVTVANDENDTWFNNANTAAGDNAAGIDAAQANDQDPTEIARIGFDLKSFGDLTKDILAVQFGASAMHDSLNTAFLSSSAATQSWADTAGWDAKVDVLKNWHLIGEWVGRNTFTPAAGLTKRQEGWYITSVMEPLKWFDKDAPQIEWNTRYEGYLPDANKIGQQVNPYITSDNAITTGIKWSFVGKNYTSVNYTVYGYSNNFGSMAGTELWTIQQQFNY